MTGFAKQARRAAPAKIELGNSFFEQRKEPDYCKRPSLLLVVKLMIVNYDGLSFNTKEDPFFTNRLVKAYQKTCSLK